MTRVETGNYFILFFALRVKCSALREPSDGNSTLYVSHLILNVAAGRRENGNLLTSSIDDSYWLSYTT